jgi:hypothetical protein
MIHYDPRLKRILETMSFSLMVYRFLPGVTITVHTVEITPLSIVCHFYLDFVVDLAFFSCLGNFFLIRCAGIVVLVCLKVYNLFLICSYFDLRSMIWLTLSVW